MKKLHSTVLFAALALAGMASAATPEKNTEGTLLLRQPSLSREHIAFVYGGNLWETDRQGHNPVQLTNDAAGVSSPHFSPDGKWIAYSANDDGNTDVYVMPAEGGTARRLTWHPSPDIVCGWSADGKRVLFASPREVANSRSNQLYEVSIDGGTEKKVMQAVAVAGAWSADGKQLAYQPYIQAYRGTSGWRQHRGGDTPPIWIMDPATQKWTSVPHVNATDINPAWAGKELVFISDRNDGAANLYVYNTETKAMRQLTHETVWDVHSADVKGSTVVYETGGHLKMLDLSGGAPQTLTVEIAAQGPQARPQWKNAGDTITQAHLSATGKRVVVSARGDVFTIPVKDGSTRNLTATPGVREKDAMWSPDGQQVAYITDAASSAPGVMKHELVLRDQDGLSKPRTYSFSQPGYYTLLAWSPDGKTLIVADNHLHLFAYKPATSQQTLIDTSERRDGGGASVSFSPDSRWLAYTTILANGFAEVRVYDFNTQQSAAVSDSMAFAYNPAFSPKGDLLYFTASTNAGSGLPAFDMSTDERPLRMGIYAAVLSADGKSPLAPKTGDEDAKKDDKKDEAKGDHDKKDGKKDDKKADGDEAKVKPVRIDFAGLEQRIVALPVSERNYDSLAVAADGALYYLDHSQPGASNDGDEESPPAAELFRFDFDELKASSLKSGVNGFDLSPDGKKILLVGEGGRLEVGDAGAKLDTKPVDTGGLRMFVDPRQEWKQIFDETWWMEQDFFYDPHMHGLDWRGVYERYEPLLASVQRREDLNQLLVEMIGELQVGHNRIGGGDLAHVAPVKVGLLGADFTVEQNRLRIAKIYTGDTWNPFLKAPLAAPGLGVKVGDYLLAVNGKPLDTVTGNLYALLQNTVGQQVTLTIAADAVGKGSRDVVVVPTAREVGLRQWDWIERNRAYVDKASGGRVAYVYLPDTAGGGFTYFNRMFFAQATKQALIVDDRKNNGGQAANYVIETLKRNYLGSWKDRDGQTYDTPAGAIYGPKAMLIDQDAGSGGDFMPYAFRQVGLGPLIGKRTWGGLIGISFNPPLIDGGSLSVPFFRFYDTTDHWLIENQGVAPDIEVELDPAAVNAGHDPQLDAAIANVLERLTTWQPLQHREAPAMPTSLAK